MKTLKKMRRFLTQKLAYIWVGGSLLVLFFVIGLQILNGIHASAAMKEATKSAFFPSPTPSTSSGPTL